MRLCFFLLFCLLINSTFAQDRKIRIPSEERPISNMDLSVNRVNYIQQNYPQLDGSGLVVSIKEFRFDSLDLDLLGKNIPSGLSASFVATHATSMATIVGGKGNSFFTGKGIAPGALLSSTSFLNIFPEPASYYLNNNISVQNHSYGLGIENFYGAEAKAYDSLVYHLPDIVQVFSVGNLGDSISLEGPYAGIPHFATLTGAFKMAKNILTVGALDAQLRLEDQSSRGPAYDGRIKPELVAYGEDGSSGAAAICSGVSLLIQQAYADQNNGQIPSADLVKATLINTADDLDAPGPSFSTGFGNINARKAIELIRGGQYFQDELGPNQQRQWQIEVPEGVQQLNITLAWLDPPAEQNAPNALLNDLDLQLVSDNTGAIYLPWILNASAVVDSLQLAAKRGIDLINPQEKISIFNPEAGIYNIQVNSGTLTTSEQAFSLAYSLDTIGHFLWTQPSKSAAFLAGNTQQIRWEYTGLEGTGEIFYRSLENMNWVSLSDEVTAAEGQYSWTIPDETGLFQLRMDIEGKAFISDTFGIAPELDLRLAFDCDSTLLYNWDAVKGVDQYRVYQLQGDQMQAIEQTRETSLLRRRKTGESDVYAVTPIIQDNWEGVRSLALIPEFQNAGCYIVGFFGSLNFEEVFIDIELGTIVEVASIQLEKLNGTDFKTIQSWTPLGLNYTYTDKTLQTGINEYRLVINLVNGTQVISETIDVFYVPQNELLIFPNPTFSGSLLEISIPNFQGRKICVFDGFGRKIWEDEFLSSFELIETANWPAGVYFYQVLDPEEVKEHEGKIIIH